MALQSSWNRYETALLIEIYMDIKNNVITREEGVSMLSSRLRNHAITLGQEIDDVYRNKNGISLRLHELGYLFGDEGGIRNTSYLFQGMVEMYKSENQKYQEILKEAKKHIPNIDENETDEEIKKELQTVDTYPAIHKKEKVVKEGFGSKLMRYFRSVISKDKTKEDNKVNDDKNVDEFLYYLDKHGIEYIDKCKSDNRIWIIDRPEYLKVIKKLKQIGLNIHFNYNTTKIKANSTLWWIDCNEITSDLLKELPIIEPLKKKDVNEGTILVHLPSKNDAFTKEPKIYVAPKFGKENRLRKYNDDLDKFLGKNGIEYYDMRNKKGCLWIVESSLTTLLVMKLASEKILFHYSHNGGKACENKSAWWTK